MRELAAKLNLPLAKSALYFTPRHTDACDNGTFIWKMGLEAEQFAEDLDELFYEILPETIPRNQLAVNN